MGPAKFNLAQIEWPVVQWSEKPPTAKRTGGRSIFNRKDREGGAKVAKKIKFHSSRKEHDKDGRPASGNYSTAGSSLVVACAPTALGMTRIEEGLKSKSPLLAKPARSGAPLLGILHY
jgi:hypothetical protein